MKEAGLYDTAAPSLQRIYYVLETFPKLSETFIVEEISALLNLGLDIHLVARNKGSFEVLHPSAQRLVTEKRVRYVSDVSRFDSLLSLAHLFLRKPTYTARVLAKALMAEDRWRYFQALPFAADSFRQKSQYIHAHFADENAWIASAIADWTGFPFGITVHGYHVRYPPLPRGVLSRVLSKAATIVTVSEYFKAYASAKLNVEPDHIYVAYNSIDISRFAPPRQRTPHETCRLISVGRLETIKGHDILIEAISHLRTQGQRISLTLIGDGKERDKLERQVREYGLENVVQFLGNLTPDSVIDHLQKSDIFVMPSRDESFGVACIEAMATELPVIASRVGGLPEFIDHGVTGLLFTPEQTEVLAAAIASLVTDPEYRMRLGAKARELVAKKFSRDEATRKLLIHLQNTTKPH
jgi:glycosyltransferase involved in cell wall biosynthesis